jgi:iron complex outermembrane receptor protein
MNFKKTVMAACAVSSMQICVQVCLAQNTENQSSSVQTASANRSTVRINQLALEEVLVKASALRSAVGEAVQPATVIRGDALQQNMANDIASVLEKSAGMSNAGFGPGVGQPVIRGLGAGRVRTLQDGTDTFDAANVSADHAISADPFSAEAIEVLRGPATLVYGSGAIGGVVNTVDTLISDKPTDGVSGKLGAGVDNGMDGKFGRAEIQLGNEMWALHANTSKVDSGDIEIPSYAESHPEAGEEKPSTLDNSSVETDNHAVGLALHQDWGFIGVGVEKRKSNYGIPVGHHGDEVVRIDLKQDRARIKGEWFEPMPGLESFRLKASVSDYEHQELEGAEVGTRFAVKGRSIRLEAVHAHIGQAKGVLGLHLKERDFSAVGEEAFVPNTKTNSEAVYAVEKFEMSESFIIEAGLRIEQEAHESDAAKDVSFGLFGASLGARWVATERLALTGNVAQGERAASAEELYANGVHVATNSYERGNSNLKKEKSLNTDVGVSWESARVSASVNGFYNQFSQFIYQATSDCNGDGIADRVEEDYTGTGCVVELDDHEPLLLDNKQGRANFVGFEAEIRYRLVDSDAAGLTLRLFGDSVKGRLSNGDNLPRIPAQRVGLAVDYRQANLQTGISWLSVLKQQDVAEFETDTSGYEKVDAYLSWQPLGENSGWTVLVRGQNLLNEDIRNHASFLKDEVPAVGRHFILATEFSY